MPTPRTYVLWLTQRHAIVVALCRVTSADQLTAQLKQRQYRSKEEVLAKMQRQAMDEDIVTGASTLKLTCPLTYMRLATPCRADTCEHIQCFDAQSFYSMNEQSPQWLCPVCNQSILSDQLRMDGYVEDILQRVPTEVDTVMVESDGTWHTTDGKYTDASPILHTLPPAPSPEEDAALDPESLAEFLMDEDDLDAPDASQPSHDPVLGSDPMTPPPLAAEQPTDVIDLTLDSDDE